jgi:hypothetical protein
MKRTLVIVTFVASLTASPALAAESRPWISFGGGFHTFAMGDVNDDIAELNTAIAPLKMDEISNGFGFDVSLGMNVSPAASIAVAYERFGSSSKIGDPTGSIEFSLPVNAITARFVYLLSPGEEFSIGLGAAAGLISSSGKVELAVTGVGAASEDFSGTGPDLEAFVNGEFRQGERFAIVPHVGFRYAKISETKLSGQVLYNADGSKYALDYTGLSSGIAFKLFFR